MPKRSALDKIEYHEKICRLMQKQTFEKIEKIESRINRLGKFILGGIGAILLAVLSNYM